MKRNIYLLLLPLIVTIAACGGKSVKDDALVLKRDSTDVHGLQRMQSSRNETVIQFKGKEYRSLISRSPNEDLPRVVSELGDTYVDNQIVLRLMRGGDQVFNMTFTKKSFASLVSDAFLAKSILEGIVYDKTTPQGMLFAASVCYPQTDLYIPISILITADGKMSMKEVEVLEEMYEEGDH